MIRRAGAVALALGLALGLASAMVTASGCGREHQEQGQTQEQDQEQDQDRDRDRDRVEPSASWFAEAPAPAGTFCAAVSATFARVPVALYVSRSVDAAASKELFERARGFAAALGVELIPAADEVRSIPRAVLFEESRRDLGPEAQRHGDALTRGLARPLVTFIDDHARGARDRINVVFLADLVGPHSPLSATMVNVAGLTVSPALDGDGAWDALLGAKDYQPTTFLSRRQLDAMPPDQAAATIVHELGHALGLPHLRDPKRLMSQRRTRACLPGLSPDERAHVASEAERLTSARR